MLVNQNLLVKTRNEDQKNLMKDLKLRLVNIYIYIYIIIYIIYVVVIGFKNCGTMF